MKAETLGNLIWVAIWAILGLSALIGAIFFGAYWLSSLLVCASLWLLFSITMMPTDARA